MALMEGLIQKKQLSHAEHVRSLNFKLELIYFGLKSNFSFVLAQNLFSVDSAIRLSSNRSLELLSYTEEAFLCFNFLAS